MFAGSPEAISVLHLRHHPRRIPTEDLGLILFPQPEEVRQNDFPM